VAAATKVSEHVYWLPPGPPDRPALCAVNGRREAAWLDAGSSTAHAREFLDFLAGERVPAPSHVVLTHAHWDHVFGASELGAHVVAQETTAAYLSQLAATDWSDEALDRRVAGGEVSAEHAENVKAELPSPRDVRVAFADLVFDKRLALELGDVRLHVRHVGGDHADDSTVAYVEPDGVLFLGDCLYEAPSGGYTSERLPRLAETVRSFGADLYVEGHSETVLSRAELDDVIDEATATVER
jgi:glyoxylase-like metal-dependent hydrolase (beta-lactamase superfamily II)